LEKSNNGSEYKVIAIINAAGTSYKTTEYSFTDSEKNSDNLVYYRLKQTDLNNQSKYFNSITQTPCAGNVEEIKICNTKEGKAFILLEMQSKGEVEINLYDILGRIVYQNKLVADAGLSREELNTMLLSEGYYICVAKANSQFKCQKIYVKNN